MKKHISYIIVALGLVFLACNKTPIGVNTYDIAYSDSVTFDKEKKVTFLDVLSDNRCPIDAECIVPGKAVIQMRATCIPGDTIFFQLSFGDGFNDNRDTTIYDIYHVELLEVLPVLRAGTEPTKEDYSIRVLVKKS